MKRVALVTPHYPTSQMRGAVLAQRGWEVHDARRPLKRDFDVGWLVKPVFGAHASVRERVRRLFIDPCDMTRMTCTSYEDVCYSVRQLYLDFAFDDYVQTNPMATAMAKKALGGDTPAHCVPHHHDPSVKQAWYNPRGHVAYAGLSAFMAPVFKVVTEACKIAGREFRHAYGGDAKSLRVLKGASLVLCTRAPRWDKDFAMRYLKPQIKVENAAAAGIPVVYNGHECEVSLHPGHAIARPDDFADPAALALVIQRALSSEPPRPALTLQRYLDLVEEIVS